MESHVVTDRLDQSVVWLQTIVAALLVILFLVGVINFGILIVTSVIEGGILDLNNVLNVILSSIDIVLYLFIIVELYKTIIAYVEAKSVVIAVIHAGLIAVVRQVITFKPGDAAGPMEAVLQAGTHALLLLVLLVGFYIVHRRIDRENREPTS